MQTARSPNTIDAVLVLPTKKRDEPAPPGSRPHLLLLFLCACLSVGGPRGAPAAPATSLPQPVQKVLLDKKIPADGLSVFVQEVSSREPLLTFNEDVPRNPASSIKLLTTFAALDNLGPAYTWKTTALSAADLRGGVLEGDLYLRGGGDPFLVTEQFWKFLLGLRNSGLREIRGDLVVDAGFFEVSPEDPGAFDGRPYHAYNVVPHPLLVNFGVTSFWFVPDIHGKRVEVVTDPPSTTLVIDNRLSFSTKRCDRIPKDLDVQVLSRDNGGSVRFSGAYPGACGRYSLTRAVATPLPFVFGTFEALWENLGGTISGGPRLGKTPPEAREIYVHSSPTLGEIVRTTNKFSNNVMSRHLLLTIGAESLGIPGTAEKARQAVRDWLKHSGLEFPELVLENGSGLSRTERISARSLGRLLLHAYHAPYMPEFIASLPLSAIDGTLRKRFTGGPMAGRLHIKTGTLDDVRTMGGYVLSRSGKVFVVVSLHNHPGIQWRLGTQVQDELLRWVFEQ